MIIRNNLRLSVTYSQFEWHGTREEDDRQCRAYPALPLRSYGSRSAIRVSYRGTGQGYLVISVPSRLYWRLCQEEHGDADS
jgi:hypothetical protein